MRRIRDVSAYLRQTYENRGHGDEAEVHARDFFRRLNEDAGKLTCEVLTWLSATGVAPEEHRPSCDVADYADIQTRLLEYTAVREYINTLHLVLEGAQRVRAGM